MNKKRLISFLCTFVMLFNICLIFSYTDSSANSSATLASTNYTKSCGKAAIVLWKDTILGNDTFDAVKSELPAGTPKQNTRGDGFNFILWKDKGLIVYGDWSSLPSAQQSFSETNLYGMPCYFQRNGQPGEYRYYGYDVLGNRFTNMYFANDINSDLSLDNRRWIYNPWNSAKVAAADKTGTIIKQSTFNDAASGDFWFGSMINNGVPQLQGALKCGIMDSGVSAPDKTNLYQYLNVLSPPTTRYEGSGRMWRLNEYGTISYQTFPIAKKEKDHTPVQVEIIPTNPQILKFTKTSDVSAEWNNQLVTLNVTVKATLKDESRYNHTLEEIQYYTRKDIDYWNITLSSDMEYYSTTHSDATKVVKPVPGKKPSKVGNTSSMDYTVTMTRGQWVAKTDNGNKVPLTSKATSIYLDTQKDDGNGTKDVDASVVPIITPTPEPAEPAPTPTPMPVPESIHIDVTLPRPAFDIVKYTPTDSTTIENAEIVSKEVNVNGTPVNYDDFFSGDYIWGIGNDGEKYIVITYISDSGKEYQFTGWIYVYDTKPRAQFNMDGSYKQNRLMTVTNNSPSNNIQLVLEHYPITSYQWSYRAVDSDGTSRRIHDISDMYKELMYKKPGVYEVELIATNTLGRVSDPYIYQFEIFEDYKPAIVIGTGATDIARNEVLKSYQYVAVSTDGDTIATNTIELWYDSDNDEVFDQKLNTYDGKNGFPEYTPTKLGRYKYINAVTEAFGEPTMPEYITPDDTVSKTEEFEFTVDNYVPMTDVYVDIPIVRPTIDTLVMLDANFTGAKTDYVKTHAMDYNNYLRTQNIIPTFNVWDMKTYTYTQPASTTYNSGGSYPPSSISYSSGGYSGTLGNTSVSNSPYTRDEGHTAYRSESKTVSESASQSGSFCTSCTPGGVPASYSSGSRSYSDGEGYSGILSCSYNYSDYNSGYCSIHTKVGIVHFSRSWTWSGTVSRTVSYWVPNLVSYNNYTGFYSGTIYKYVRQPYTDPFKATSYKYVIYVSDGTVSELGDLKKVMSTTDAKLILIGSEAIKSQISYDYFITNDGVTSVDSLMKQALQLLTENNPAISKYYVLAGTDPLTLNTQTIDEEKDPITEQKFEYVQDVNYFDNPTGMNSNAVTEFSSALGWTDIKLLKFDKVGKYEIYTRAKDRPTTDVNFAEFNYYSGTPNIIVYAHRKPFAVATLDWDYDAARNVYLTKWVDASYDLDHNLSMANKGIVDRKIMFRKQAEEWQYKIPGELAYGTYEVNYYVKDAEGVWSDPWTYTFTLANVPPMQFKADLKSQLAKFGLNSETMGTTDLTSKGIPSTESLEGFNLWTRFAYNVDLKFGFWNGSSYVTAPKLVNYSSGAGTKANNDITWNSVPYQIPARKADNSYLSDGTYTFRIEAIGEYSQTAHKDFLVNVKTPIDLVPSMPELVTIGDPTGIKATTSKYVSTVTAVLYNGTPYQTTVSLTGILNGENKDWTVSHTVPGSIPVGNYTAVFTATAVNGGVEVKSVPYRVEALKITSVKLTGYWNHWRGQTDMFGEVMTNEHHRFLSYEAVKVDVETIGNPDKITVEFSPELQAMQFTDKYGNVYDYKKDIGYYVAFPLQLNMISANSATIDYTLPLANSTKDTDNNQLRPGYWMKVTAYKGATTKTYILDGTPGNELIEITGNIYDNIYIQPVGK